MSFPTHSFPDLGRAGEATRWGSFGGPRYLAAFSPLVPRDAQQQGLLWDHRWRCDKFCGMPDR